MYSLGGMVAIVGGSTRTEAHTRGSHVGQGDRDRTGNRVLKPKNTS